MKTLNIKLLHNYVLVKKEEKENSKINSGLILADNDSIAYGKVVAVGRGRLLESGNMAEIDVINIGDNIMYKKGADSIVNIDGESYVLISDVAVIMILCQD